MRDRAKTVRNISEGVLANDTLYRLTRELPVAPQEVRELNTLLRTLELDCCELRRAMDQAVT